MRVARLFFGLAIACVLLGNSRCERQHKLNGICLRGCNAEAACEGALPNDEAAVNECIDECAADLSGLSDDCLEKFEGLIACYEQNGCPAFDNENGACAAHVAGLQGCI